VGQEKEKEEEVTPEMIVYLFIAGCFGILFKIVWDWLISLKKSNGTKEIYQSNGTKEIYQQRMNIFDNGIREICRQRMDMFDNEICRLYERLEKIEEKLETALDKINKKMDEKFELLIKMLTQDRS